MEKQKNPDLKNSLIGTGVIFLYLIASAFPYEFLEMFGINYNNLNITLKSIYLILYEVSLIVVSFLLYLLPDISARRSP